MSLVVEVTIPDGAPPHSPHGVVYLRRMDNESDFLQAQVCRPWAVTLQAQQPGTGSDHTYFAVHRRYNGVQPQEGRCSEPCG